MADAPETLITSRGNIASGGPGTIGFASPAHWNPLTGEQDGSPATYKAKATAALQPARAALAKRTTTPFNIVVIGDSTDEGTGPGVTAADRLKSWPNRLADLLRARFPTSGELGVATASNFTPVRSAGSVATGFTEGGTWSTQQPYGPNSFAAFSSVAGSTLTYTLPVGTTAFEVLSLGGGTITGYTVTIDGGVASPTQGLGGSIRDGYVSTRFTVASGSTHTVVITSVGANCYIDGLLIYQGNENAGIRVFNAGKHGSLISSYQVGVVPNWIKASQSPTVLAGVQSIIGLNPDLLIMGHGYNDFKQTAGGTPAVYAQNMQNVVDAVRAVLPGKAMSVLWLGKWVPGPTWTSASTAGWQDFVAAQKAKAAADPLAVHFDLSSAMPAPPGLSLYADDVHCVGAGYQMVADALANFIAP